MSIPLVDALRMVDLTPGHVYRERVNDLDVEVKVSAADQPTPELAEQVMLQRWGEPPPSDAARLITVTRGEPMLPRPFHPDESDLAPGDLPESEPG